MTMSLVLNAAGFRAMVASQTRLCLRTSYYPRQFCSWGGQNALGSTSSLPSISWQNSTCSQKRRPIVAANDRPPVQFCEARRLSIASRRTAPDPEYASLSLAPL